NASSVGVTGVGDAGQRCHDVQGLARTHRDAADHRGDIPRLASERAAPALLAGNRALALAGDRSAYWHHRARALNRTVASTQTPPKGVPAAALQGSAFRRRRDF